MTEFHTPIANMAPVTQKRGFSVATIAKGETVDILILREVCLCWIAKKNNMDRPIETWHVPELKKFLRENKVNLKELRLKVQLVEK